MFLMLYLLPFISLRVLMTHNSLPSYILIIYFKTEKRRERTFKMCGLSNRGKIVIVEMELLFAMDWQISN